MAARQDHGFCYQDSVLQRIGGEPTVNYTDEWDGYYNSYPISVKTSKKGKEVYYGDMGRNIDKNQDFLMFVGFYNDTNTHEVVEEYCLFIPHTEWKKYFSNNLFQDYKTLLAVTSNDHADDIKWRKAIDALRKRWKEEVGSTIVPRPKRDSKTQKRIQCATSYKNFIEVLVPKFGVDFNEWSYKISG